MDYNHRADAPTRPSGLPRPASKLPLPKSSIHSLRQQPSLNSLSRPTSASNVRTKASVAALASRTRTPLVNAQVNDRAPSHLRNTSTTTQVHQDGAIKKLTSRPLSRANLGQQAKHRQASSSSSKTSTYEDDLRSLNSYGENTCSTAATSPSTTPITPTFRKTSRPSLSERTIESLSQVPPSPARRRSSFFSPDRPMQTRSRPASSMGNASRPSTRDGTMLPPMLTTPRALQPKPSLPNLSSNSTPRGTPSRFPNGNSAKTVRARSPTKSSLLKSVEKELVTTPVLAKTIGRVPMRGSKTVIGKMPAPRGSVADLFGSDLVKAPIAKPVARPTVKKAVLKPAVIKEVDTASPKANSASKSSNALREQIRAAKAARASFGKLEAQSSGPRVPDFDPTQFKDPFNIKIVDERSIISKRVDAAKSDGRLNISAMQLKDIPEEVLKMYDYNYNKDNDIPWNEVMDLIKFIAADNEIETIPDAVFPDVDGSDWNEDSDDASTPKFAGLEILDLHGNNLFDVPMGLRRLGCLTSLNLSRNRLMNDSLETISQISCLRELKIADNLLTGELTFIESLINLEVLDVSGNKLSVLPDELRQLTRLRNLNVSNNQLTELPMKELSGLPLVELVANKNKLTGTLSALPGTSMTRLANLDVSGNRLTALYTGSAGPEFPSLRTLTISFNQITSLPDITAWTSLSSIMAQDNKLTALPEGFVESVSLKTVDLTGNDLVKLDERIALMDGLENFKIAANPLRERKFLTMSTPALKKDLSARLDMAGFAA